MPLLNQPHCPRCSAEIDLERVWEIMSLAGRVRFGVVQETCGIRCTQCGLKIRILQDISLLTLVLLLGFGIAAAVALPIQLGKGAPVMMTTIALMIASFFLYMHRRLAPRLVRVREMRPSEILVFPIDLDREALVQQKEQAKIEDEWAAELAADEFARRAGRHDWNCPRCQMNIPANFLGCWKCGEGRPEAVSR